MDNNNPINKIASKIKSLLPSDLERVKSDFSDNVKALLQGKLQDLNLVTREEFDVQTKLLAKAQEKIEQLEKELTRIAQK